MLDLEVQICQAMYTDFLIFQFDCLVNFLSVARGKEERRDQYNDKRKCRNCTCVILEDDEEMGALKREFQMIFRSKEEKKYQSFKN